MMNVRELIELLGRYPGDMRVVVNGYENGYDDLTPGQIRITPVMLNTGAHEWEGRHGDVCELLGDARANAQTVPVLALSRTSH